MVSERVEFGSRAHPFARSKYDYPFVPTCLLLATCRRQRRHHRHCRACSRCSPANRARTGLRLGPWSLGRTRRAPRRRRARQPVSASASVPSQAPDPANPSAMNSKLRQLAPPLQTQARTYREHLWTRPEQNRRRRCSSPPRGDADHLGGHAIDWPVSGARSARIPYSGSWQMGCSGCCPTAAQRTGASDCQVSRKPFLRTARSTSSPQVHPGRLGDCPQSRDRSAASRMPMHPARPIEKRLLQRLEKAFYSSDPPQDDRIVRLGRVSVIPLAPSGATGCTEHGPRDTSRSAHCDFARCRPRC